MVTNHNDKSANGKPNVFPGANLTQHFVDFGPLIGASTSLKKSYFDPTTIPLMKILPHISTDSTYLLTNFPTKTIISVLTYVPTDFPTYLPTETPMSLPTNVPTYLSTETSTSFPTNVPTKFSTKTPTSFLTNLPTNVSSYRPIGIRRHSCFYIFEY